MEESHNKQLLSMDSWKLFRIMAEFVDGFESMLDLGPSVSVFGSARLQPDSPYYQLVEETTGLIAKKGFAVITGGGPGLMEAANKGAMEAGGKSCGVGIDLPFEAQSNGYIDQKYNLNFRYFFVRKVMFVRYARAFVVFPGGVGTIDELFEALTLMQTGKVRPFPIYLLGKSYWAGLLEWMRSSMLTSGCISEADLERIIVTDTPEDVADGIEQHYLRAKTYKNF
jgi:uncharacterized protein (TIGR00730 family)